MKHNLLPLGSVVTLKNGDQTELLIVARGPVVQQEEGQAYFDYGSVTVPFGLVDPQKLYFFNHENIESIVFEGYCNEAEKVFAANYSQYIEESGLPKASVL